MSTNINVDMLISHLVNQGSAGPATQTVNADQLLALLVNTGSFSGNLSVNADQVIALIVEQRLQPPIIVNQVDQVIVLIVEQRRVQQWTFQDPTGAPIAFGKVTFDPSTDFGGNGQVVAGVTTSFTLDATGSVITHLWSTDQQPGSHYTIQVFTALGEPCFNRQAQFTAAGAITWLT